jgi:arginine decarboxylase
VQHGRQLLDDTLRRARLAADRLAEIPGLRVLRPEHLAGPGTGLHQIDETKLLIGTDGDARAILRRLNDVHGVQPELAGAEHLLCITTIGTTDGDIDRLVAGLAESVAHVGPRSAAADSAMVADLLALRPEVLLTPREAFFAAAERVPLSAARGRTAAEAVTPYPPGIPLVMPGERLDPEMLMLLAALRAAGNPISAADPTLDSITVVA